MKKVRVLILAVVMCISFCSCNSKENTNQKNHYPIANNGRIYITQDELIKHSERIDLTLENWEDFFEIKISTISTTDAFGESTGEVTSVYVHLKDGYFISWDNALRFTYYDKTNHDNKRVADAVFNHYEGSRLYPLSGANTEREIICEKVKGTIYKIKVPEEKWNTHENGDKYLLIEGFDSKLFSFDASHEALNYES